MVEHGTYTGKKSTIEAFRWNGESPDEWPEWARKSMLIRYEITSLQIDGKHGAVRANRGDWVIFLNEEDIYPCDDEVFRRKYEPAEGVFETAAAARAAGPEETY